MPCKPVFVCDNDPPMYRIAYCTPLNPQASGIADYSEELLPFLGQYVDIDVFAERGVVPTNVDLQRHLRVLPIDTLPERHRQQPYDAVVYQMGNSPAHSAIYETLLQVPGVVVLHDWVLHHFKLGYAAAHNRLAQYRAELTARYGRVGQRAADRMLRGQLTNAVFGMPLNDDVLGAARGVVGHSRWIIERVQAAQPTLPAAVVPMGVPLPPPIPRDHARHVLGLPVDQILWASFGHINPYKRIEGALRAFGQFRAAYPTARYLLVGSVSPNYPLDAIIARLGVGDAVTVLGHVPAAHFAHYVAAADLCLNLRYPTAGETSASLLRLLGAGRPTLVSAIDAFNELPDSVCPKVDPDHNETALIFHYAHLLHTTPQLAIALGNNARAFVAQHHTLEQAAAGYIDFLTEVYGWQRPTTTRPPVWTLANEALDTVAAAMVASKPSSTSPIVAGLGQALAELGVTEHDQPVLAAVSEVVAEVLG